MSFDREKSDNLFTALLDYVDKLNIECNANGDKFEYSHYTTLHDMVCQLYDSFAEAETSRWISVEDKLPDYDGDAIVFCKNGNIRIDKCWCAGDKTFIDGSGKLCSRYQPTAGFAQSNPTYWQPTPKPPKRMDK